MHSQRMVHEQRRMIALLEEELAAQAETLAAAQDLAVANSDRVMTSMLSSEEVKGLRKRIADLELELSLQQKLNNLVPSVVDAQVRINELLQLLKPEKEKELSPTVVDVVELSDDEPPTPPLPRPVEPETPREPVRWSKATVFDDCVEVRASAIADQGLFATKRIRSNTIICEYQGERLTESEAEKRDILDYQIHARNGIIIDALCSGHVSRFVNHSRANPNVVFTWRRGCVWLKAIRDIEPDEELLVDYGIRDEAVIARNPWLDDRPRYDRGCSRCGFRPCLGEACAKKRDREENPPGFDAPFTQSTPPTPKPSPQPYCNLCVPYINGRSPCSICDVMQNLGGSFAAHVGSRHDNKALCPLHRGYLDACEPYTAKCEKVWLHLRWGGDVSATPVSLARRTGRRKGERKRAKNNSEEF